MRRPSYRRRTLAFIVAVTACSILRQSWAEERISWYPFKISSGSGNAQFSLTGRVLLEGFAPGLNGSGLITQSSSFLSGRGSIFADLFLGKHWYATSEFRADTGEVPQKEVLSGRVEQAFLRYRPSLRNNLYLQYGKFVSPFGAYNQRHDSAADPFIRPPLMYDYRTMVSSNFIPRSNDGFIHWKNAPHIWRPVGAPVIWGNPYQIGAMFFGSVRKFDFRLALMGSSISSEPASWNQQPWRQNHPSYVVHAGYRLLPELYLGAAYSAGPYLGRQAKSVIPEDEFNSYQQKTWGIEFLYEKHKTQIRGELFRDLWYVENVIDRPVDLSGYVEIKQKFNYGFFGALRYGAIHFNRIHLSGGGKENWDFNRWRGQAAFGYRISQSLEVRTESMWNLTKSPIESRDTLVSLQLRLEF